MILDQKVIKGETNLVIFFLTLPMNPKITNVEFATVCLLSHFLALSLLTVEVLP